MSQVLLEVHEGDRIADPYGKIPIVRHARAGFLATAGRSGAPTVMEAPSKEKKQ